MLPASNFKISPCLPFSLRQVAQLDGMLRMDAWSELGKYAVAKALSTGKKILNNMDMRNIRRYQKHI